MTRGSWRPGSSLRWAWVVPAVIAAAGTAVVMVALNAVAGRGTEGLTRHRVNPVQQTASSSPSSQAPNTGSGTIQLKANGLDSFDFGSPRDDVISTLTDRFGTPDEEVDQPCRRQPRAPSHWVRWADLSLRFSESEFLGYIEGSHYPPGSLPLDLATPDGLSPGDSIERVRRIHGDVHLRRQPPQPPGRRPTYLFTIINQDSPDRLTGVVERTRGQRVVIAIFAGNIC